MSESDLVPKACQFGLTSLSSLRILENALSRHSDHPLLASIHNPSVLARSQGISEDVIYLLGLHPGEDWSTHPLAVHHRSHPPAALTEYLERLRSLEFDTHCCPPLRDDCIYPAPPAEQHLLLSHAYVRYMGDLNGGQIIKESVSRAYHLEENSSDGLRFYRFEDDNGEEASPAELGKLASRYRIGMDHIGNQLTSEQRGVCLLSLVAN